MDSFSPLLACLLALGLGLPSVLAWLQASAQRPTPSSRLRDRLDARMDAARALRERLDATDAWRRAHLDGQDTPVDLFLDTLVDAVFVRRGFTPVPHSRTDPPGTDALRNGVVYLSWGIDQLDEDRPARVVLDIWDSTSFHLHAAQHPPQQAPTGHLVFKPPVLTAHALPAWLHTAIATRAVHNGVPVSVAGIARRRFAAPQPVSHHRKLAAYAALHALLPPGVDVEQAIDDVEGLCRKPA